MNELPTVLYLGGNGHAPVRLAAARAEIAQLPQEQRFEIHDLLYPGFAGRPAARDFTDFLVRIEREIRELPSPALVHATGIGAMIALALRARGALVGVPTVFLGPVLWGLEVRRFPAAMRLPGVAKLVEGLLGTSVMQRRFARKHFGDAADPAFVDAFFEGYDQCRHFADLFHWFTPDYLRVLERELAATPGSLRDIQLWWGDGDAVVGEQEADVTEHVLGVIWPRRSFAGWGHYPMIDDPAGWVREVGRAVAPALAAG